MDSAKHRVARPRHASDRRAALRAGPPGRATHQAAGLRYAPGRWAALCVRPRAALHDRPTTCTASPRRWTFGPTDGRRRYILNTYQWTSRPGAPGVYSRIHVPYAGSTIGGRTQAAKVYYTLLDRTTRAVIFLHLLGPTAIIGAGPAGGRMINVGQPSPDLSPLPPVSLARFDPPPPPWPAMYSFPLPDLPLAASPLTLPALAFLFFPGSMAALTAQTFSQWFTD
jgi:hypothetical protein